MEKITESSEKFPEVFLKKFIRIKDASQRVALGLGLGVFLGIIPGTGPLAALLLAGALRINIAAAVLGCLVVNTWFTIITFLASVKVGSWIMRVNWQEEYQSWQALIKNFHFASLFSRTVFRSLLPIAVGYIIVAFFAGFVVYLIALIILTGAKKCRR